MPSATLKTKLGQRVLDLGGSAANDTTGAFVPVVEIGGHRAAYGAWTGSFTPVANATDVFQLFGSSGKLIRVRSIIISGTATAAAQILVGMILRTALNSGGTPVAITPCRQDSADDAVSATVQTYSANPSALGAGIAFRGGRLGLSPPSNGPIDRLIFKFGANSDKAPVLQSASQSVCLNLGGGVVPAGAALEISCSWSEELAESVL